MKYRESNRCEFRAKLAEMFAKICILATLPHLGKMRVLGGFWGPPEIGGFCVFWVLGKSVKFDEFVGCENL